jgi:L-arabinokinase
MAHVVAYVTGHGFGHATRMAAVLAALAGRVADLRLSVVSTAPEWLFRLNLPMPFAYRRRALDVGVVQVDSIRLDARATLAAAARLLDEEEGTVAEEAAYLAREGADLVVADIPPAAFLAAERAGIPSVGISNFTWDWIYADYVRAHPEFGGVPERVRAAYARAGLFLRLPFHGPCDPFRDRRDIPLVARKARVGRDTVRASLGVDAGRPLVLLSFGGFNIQGLDLDRVERMSDCLFLMTQPLPRPLRNVRHVTPDGFRYEDYVAAADAVITKPGYGIVSDCLANRTPVLYTDRGRFAEYDRLVEGLETFGVVQYVPSAELLAGHFEPALRALIRRPQRWRPLPAEGAEAAGDMLAARLNRGAAEPPRAQGGGA